MYTHGVKLNFVYQQNERERRERVFFSSRKMRSELRRDQDLSERRSRHCKFFHASTQYNILINFNLNDLERNNRILGHRTSPTY